MVSEALAIILSVSLILIFGEVIPQAVCSKWSLAIGGNVWWVVLLLMILVFVEFTFLTKFRSVNIKIPKQNRSPIAWPISILLDLILGSDHAEFFRRKQLTELVEIHGREKHVSIHFQANFLSFHSINIFFQKNQKTVNDQSSSFSTMALGWSIVSR